MKNLMVSSIEKELTQQANPTLRKHSSPHIVEAVLVVVVVVWRSRLQFVSPRFSVFCSSCPYLMKESGGGKMKCVVESLGVRHRINLYF